MNRKFCFKHSFTLVELIVSLAVFSILLTVMLQFFSGAQRLWTNTESRNQLYSDARVAMDLMSTLLQNAYYAQEAAPFAIDQAEPLTSNDKENRNSSMYFGTKAKMDLGGKAAIRLSPSSGRRTRIWPTARLKTRRREIPLSSLPFCTMTAKA